MPKIMHLNTNLALDPKIKDLVKRLKLGSFLELFAKIHWNPTVRIFNTKHKCDKNHDAYVIDLML